MNGLKNFLNKKILLIFPIIIFNGLFFFGSFISGVQSSFGNRFYENGWFIDGQLILLNDSIMKNLSFTIKIAFITTLISLSIGIVGIYIIYQYPLIKQNLKKLLYLPLLTPYLLIAFFMMYAFSTSGLLNRILYALGFIDSLKQAPIFINDLNGRGIILAYIWKTAPFIILVLINSLENFDFRLIKIAESLGNSKFQSFIHILWPQIKNSFLYAGIIVFTFIFSSVEIPLVLGPTRPQMISHWAYQNFQNGDIIYRSRSFAMGTIILILNIIITVMIGYQLLGQVTYEKNN